MDVQLLQESWRAAYHTNVSRRAAAFVWRLLKEINQLTNFEETFIVAISSYNCSFGQNIFSWHHRFVMRSLSHLSARNAHQWGFESFHQTLEHSNYDETAT